MNNPNLEKTDFAAIIHALEYAATFNPDIKQTDEYNKTHTKITAHYGIPKPDSIQNPNREIVGFGDSAT